MGKQDFITCTVCNGWTLFNISVYSLPQINFCTDGISIFNFMHDQGIGWKCASFYEAYATELENLGNTKKADAVYLEGIHKNAEPKENIHL